MTNQTCEHCGGWLYVEHDREYRCDELACLNCGRRAPLRLRPTAKGKPVVAAAAASVASHPFPAHAA
ncbi:MAG: hypothetical protein HY329_19005 [Chloroflexi bacterium]|nr:hypothetical protein [Chloroflexota bacterium]